MISRSARQASPPPPLKAQLPWAAACAGHPAATGPRAHRSQRCRRLVWRRAASSHAWSRPAQRCRAPALPHRQGSRARRSRPLQGPTRGRACAPAPALWPSAAPAGTGGHSARRIAPAARCRRAGECGPSPAPAWRTKRAHRRRRRPPVHRGARPRRSRRGCGTATRGRRPVARASCDRGCRARTGSCRVHSCPAAGRERP